MMNAFLSVTASRQALPMSVAHILRSLSSVRKSMMRTSPLSETTLQECGYIIHGLHNVPCDVCHV